MKQRIKFRLHEILKERGLTIQGFARDAKLNRITVSRICHNQTLGITLDMMARIASALDIPLSDLFEAEKIKK